MSNTVLTLCNGIFDESDTEMLLRTLSAIYSKEEETISIRRAEGNLTLSVEDFEAALDNWIMLGPSLANSFNAFLRIVNNEFGEAGGFIEYIKDFVSD